MYDIGCAITVAFIIIAILSAVVGWAVIQGLIWLF